MSVKVCSINMSSICCQNPYPTPHSVLTPTQHLTLKKKIIGPKPLKLFLEHTSAKYGISRGEIKSSNFQSKAASSPSPPPPPPSRSNNSNSTWGEIESSNFQSNAASSPPPPPPPSPGNNSSSPWKKWLMGVAFSVALPAATHKGGAFVALKAKIDQTIATVDTITDVVEDIAEQADKLVDEVESKLPVDSNLRKTIERLDDLTDIALQHAQKAEALVEKVKNINEQLFDERIPDDADQDKGIQETSSKEIPPRKVINNKENE